MRKQPEILDEAAKRAERYIREALVRLGNEDVIPLLDAAIQCERVAMGEADPSTIDDLTDSCSCPPDLVARGGFTSTCPAHGVATLATASERETDR